MAEMSHGNFRLVSSYSMRTSQFGSSLSKIRLADVRPYLEARGWTRKGEFQNTLAIFGRGDSSLEQILVPLNPQYEDFGIQMEDAVTRIAREEQRPAQAIIQDLLSTNVDTLRFSVRSAATSRGTLPLDQGLSLLGGARRSLLAAACTVLAPSAAYHPRLSRSDAEGFIQACELGQTEHGSYTVTLRCPMNSMDYSDPLQLSDKEPPFARRATETLVDSVSRLVHAIDQDHIETVLQPSDTHARLTANLCDALIQMQPDSEDASISLAVSWAVALRPRVSTNAVIIRGDHFSAISEISKQLRGSPVAQAAPFVALVDELRGSDLAEDGRRCGDVRLTIYHEDEVIRARANLNADQYAFAVGAHMHGSYILVTGVLNRGARLSTLTDLVGIREVEQATITSAISHGA